MRKIALLAFAAIGLYSCQPSNSFTIKGDVTGAPNQTVYLLKIDENQPKPIDSVQIENGKFAFEGIVEQPEIYVLQFGKQDKTIALFIEAGKIDIKANFDSLQAATIKGSKAHDLMMGYSDKLGEYQTRMEAVSAKFQEAYYNGTLTAENEAALRADYEVISKELGTYILGFVNQNLTSVVAPYIIANQLADTMDIVRLENLAASIKAPASETVYAKDLNERIAKQKKIAVGQPAPEITLPDPDGNMISLSSLRGKYVLIDFWAAWCGPCRRENPNVVKVYSQYKDKGFEIFGVSLDYDRESWLKGIKDDGITWLQVSEVKGWETQPVQDYQITGIPHTVLIDPNGIIIEKNLRGEQLEAKLAEIFK
ncbi:Thiol-disulfide oxidoreductase ResA [anaerobic digester metagenome]